jgi:MoxR-like ATPase
MSKPLELIHRLEENIGRALVGKPEAVRLAVVGLLARGHLLIEDVPGVGKTTLAAALARSIGAGFQRIQFTSDMLPSDVLGVSVWEPKSSEFVFKPGPLFTNIVLADYPLPQPFMVLATQNPREYEGTFPLPESQLDRFLLRIRIGYPDAPGEKAVLRGTEAPAPARLQPVLTEDQVLELQEQAEQVRAEESVLDYVVNLVNATRRSPLFTLGVSPRGSLALLRAARARALADGRDYLVPDDIKGLAVSALAHRVMVKARLGQSGGMDGEAAIRAILQDVPVPR